MTNEELVEDLKVMIEADRKNMDEAITRGWPVEAHRHLDALMENTRQLEDLQR